MAIRTTLTQAIPERTTPVLVVNLVDGSGAPILAIDTLTATLYDVSSNTVINSRTSVDMLPFLVAGRLTWNMTALDTVIVRDRKDAVERHRVLLIWTWQSGSKAGAHEVDIFVTNLNKVGP